MKRFYAPWSHASLRSQTFCDTASINLSNERKIAVAVLEDYPKDNDITVLGIYNPKQMDVIITHKRRKIEQLYRKKGAKSSELYKKAMGDALSYNKIFPLQNIAFLQVSIVLPEERNSINRLISEKIKPKKIYYMF